MYIVLESEQESEIQIRNYFRKKADLYKGSNVSGIKNNNNKDNRQQTKANPRPTRNAAKTILKVVRWRSSMM